MSTKSLAIIGALTFGLLACQSQNPSAPTQFNPYENKAKQDRHSEIQQEVLQRNASINCARTRHKMQEYYDRGDTPPAFLAGSLTYWCVNLGGE